MNNHDAVRRYEISVFGEADTLQQAMGLTPEVTADLVRIRVQYAGLNFADVMARRGLYPLVDASMLPFTPGMEIVGEIEAVGPDVSGLNVGQRVFAKLEMGGYSDYVVAPASYVFGVPDGIDSAEVLGLVGTSGQTAYGAAMSLKPADGRSVFITAAAGGVGSVLIQLCKHLGWTVIAGVSSAEKAALVASLGADHTVRYDQTGWEETLKGLAGEQGLAAALDSVGGAPNRGALAALGNHGELVFFGGASGDLVGLPTELVFPFVAGCKSVRGFGLVGYYMSGPDVLNKTIQGLFDAKLTGTISSITTTTFPAADVAEAHRQLESRQSQGKLQLDMLS
ncbi:MAG: zinc-binding dehydrogenase [Pseudomonadota bacterium]